MNLAKMLVIGGNNILAARMVSLLDGKVSHISGSSGTKAGMTQATTSMENVIIWKPIIVDGKGYRILKTHHGLRNPPVTNNMQLSCILLLDHFEMKNLVTNNSSSYLMT